MTRPWFIEMWEAVSDARFTPLLCFIAGIGFGRTIHRWQILFHARVANQIREDNEQGFPRARVWSGRR